MTVTVEQVLSYIGANEQDAENVVTAGEVLVVATIMVEKFVGASDVPSEVVDMAVLRLSEELWSQRHTSPTVSSQFYENAPVSLAPKNRDPFLPAYQLLKNWVSPW